MCCSMHSTALQPCQPASAHLLPAHGEPDANSVMLCSDLRGVEEAQPGRDNEASSAGGQAKPRRFTSEMLEQLSVIDQEVTDVMAAEADRDAAVVQHTQLMTEAQVRPTVAALPYACSLCSLFDALLQPLAGWDLPMQQMLLCADVDCFLLPCQQHHYGLYMTACIPGVCVMQDASLWALHMWHPEYQ